MVPDASRGTSLSLRPLVEPVTVVGSTTTCAEVDASFRKRWTSSSILVLPPHPGDHPGLVTRSRFLATMAGYHGEGRALWETRPIGDLATWDSPTLRESATLAQAAALLGDGSEGYSDLVVVDEHNNPIGIVRPVRVMQALADRAVQEAATDHLTGVASRSCLVERLGVRLAAIGSSVGAVIVAYVDLDRLKAVNDALGHSWGDALLRSAARRIGQRLRPSDLIGRLGGDEFAIVRCLLPAEVADVDLLALELGDDLCAAVGSTDPHLPSLAQSRASVGITVTTSADTSVDAILHAADRAMYAAKAAGGDRVCIAGSGELEPVSWADGRRLEVVYQPIVDTDSRQVVAVEALLRQRNADGGLDGPMAALDSAARAGMSLDLDRWVLDRACRDMAGWVATHGDRAPAAVHVNLAADSLGHPGLVKAVLGTIDATGLPRNRVRLELSEHAGVPEMTEAMERLDEIARGGVGIALDDLGATLDTLRILDRLPVDALKIDRSVVVGAGAQAPIDTEVLSLLVRLGRQFGLELVGEGVEHGADERTLLVAGVRLMQGFRYSHPVPADEIDDFTYPESLPSPRPAPDEPVAAAGAAARGADALDR